MAVNVLVTGGAGFIGSHLIRLLESAGHRAVVLDNFHTGMKEHVPAGMEIVEMDIRDKALCRYMQGEHFDAIVHLAGQTMVDASIRDPENDAQVNILGTINLLEAARRCHIGRVIFASTAASYGNVTAEELPVLESKALAPMSFYGLSKVTVERYLEIYRELFGMDYVVLRFANVYGERQGDGGEGGVISIFAKRIVTGEDITIYGDGEQTRDFVYAGDIAKGILAALVTKNVNTAYNLSTQTETSLRELVSLLSKVVERDIIPLYGPERPGDIRRSMLAKGKAQRGLMWKPETPLLEGLRRTVDYFESASSK